MNAPDPLFGDAVTNPQRWNRYAYVANSPLRFTDPSGMQYKAQTVGYSCSLTNCVSLPAQEMSDAAKEGSVDLIVSGVNATFGGENLGAGGVMPGHQFLAAPGTRPSARPSDAVKPRSRETDAQDKKAAVEAADSSCCAVQGRGTVDDNKLRRLADARTRHIPTDYYVFVRACSMSGDGGLRLRHGRDGPPHINPTATQSLTG